MDVILLQDVQALGTAGDIVKVKPGYARNYLFPRGFALRSSKPVSYTHLTLPTTP